MFSALDISKNLIKISQHTLLDGALGKEKLEETIQAMDNPG